MIFFDPRAVAEWLHYAPEEIEEMYQQYLLDFEAIEEAKLVPQKMPPTRCSMCGRFMSRDDAHLLYKNGRVHLKRKCLNKLEQTKIEYDLQKSIGEKPFSKERGMRLNKEPLPYEV